MRRSVLRGQIAVNDPMPSVRQLAGELRVNPNTVQQAYGELEREGLIHVKRGSGSFVAPGARREGIREEVGRAVAEAALREASRSGLTPEELIAALQEMAQTTRLDGTGDEDG